MGVRIEDLQLVWPRDVFVAELLATTVAVHAGLDDEVARWASDETTRWLFEEAFYADSGVRWFDAARSANALDRLLMAIVDDPSQVPLYAPPVLFRDRKGGVGGLRQRPKLSGEGFVEALGGLTAELEDAGYFDFAFGDSCGDSENDHPGRGEAALSDLLGSPESWPPLLSDLDLDHAYTVLEALHYVVARPRNRWWHDFYSEWHYGDFDRPAGQDVYRWRVNELLDRSDARLRLDVDGLLVETTGDPRDELLDALARDPDAPAPDALQHAIEQFRRRGASRVEKRAAVVSLAGILEEHRSLLKDEMLSGDEGALFEIANRYSIRHQRADQRPDYDDAYLDWIFWWYLATVDLVKHLLARGPEKPEE